MSNSSDASGSDPDGVTSSQSMRKKDKKEQGIILKVVNIVIVLAAVAGLVLSLINWQQANADPQIGVFLPRIVRVFAQPRSPVSSPFVGIVIEPTYALLRNSEKTAVISDVSLRLTPPDKSIPGPSSVAWLQVSGLATNGGQNSAIPFGVDPSPIVITQSTPQSPHLMFAAYGMENITPGRWNFTLTTRRADSKVITNSSCINISPAWAQFVNRSSLGSPIVPIFRNNLGLSVDPAGCYRGDF